MKNIFKKIGYGIVFVAIIGVIAFAGNTNISAEEGASHLGPGNYVHNALIHRGAGHQFINGVLRLSDPLSVMFGTTSDNGFSAVFEKPEEPKKANTSFFAVLDNSWIGGNLFVGVERGDDGFNFNDGLSGINNWMKTFTNPATYEDFTSTIQKVNVEGDVLATSLKHLDTIGDHVCIDENGSLEICTNYSCANVPEHSSRCDSEELSEDTNAVLNDKCLTTPACQYACDLGYHYDDSSKTPKCVVNICTGGTPDKSELCAGDDSGLSENTSKLLVNECNTGSKPDRKCEYECIDGYHYNSSKAEPGCVEDADPIHGSCDISVNNGCSAGTLNDVRDNDDYYLWECLGTDGGDSVSCSKEKPVSVINGECKTYTGSYATQPATDDASGCINGTYVNESDTPATDTYWNWHCSGSGSGSTTDSCLATIEHHCTGSIPLHSNLCSGDDTGLASDTTRAVAVSCGSPKCEYRCDTGYHKEGAACIINSYTCDGEWTESLNHCNFYYDENEEDYIPADFIMSHHSGSYTIGATSLTHCKERILQYCSSLENYDPDHYLNVNHNNDSSLDDGQCYNNYDGLAVIHFYDFESFTTTSVVHYCSDINPTNETDCESQHDGSTCTWDLD